MHIIGHCFNLLT